MKGLTLAIALFASPAVASDFLLVGPISHVRDGDTILVSGQPVRLKGIAAPEKSEWMGPESTAGLKALEGRQVVCRLTGEVSYDRLVGWCALVGDDLGQLQITAGLARRCAAFDPMKRYPDDTGTGLPLPSYCTGGN